MSYAARDGIAGKYLGPSLGVTCFYAEVQSQETRAASKDRDEERLMFTTNGFSDTSYAVWA